MVYIGAHIPMYIWKGAIGIEAYNESFGIFKNNYFTSSYNYVLVNNLGLFSLGGRVGLHSLSIDGSIIKTPEGIYTTGGSNHNDPTLENGVTSGISPFFEAGVYFDNKFVKGGIAVSQFPSTNINASNAIYRNSTHARLFFQYNYHFDNSLIIKPSISVRSDFIFVQTDVNILAEINGNIFGAVGVRGYESRSLDAISVMAGTNLNKNYRISYQFDINISELKRVNEGTHELILNYNLNKPIATGLPPKAIYNPRDL
jgi:type IX secretion system PorP/SprF family membrane protein